MSLENLNEKKSILDLVNCKEIENSTCEKPVESPTNTSSSFKCGINIYRRPSSVHQNMFFAGRNYLSLPTDEDYSSSCQAIENESRGGSFKSNRSTNNNNLFLMPPSLGRRLSRQRQGSAISNCSVDNVSHLSHQTIAPEEEEDDNDNAQCLLLARLEKVPMKDFCAEIRGKLDIKKFLKEATLLLDVMGSNMEEIIDQMLASVLDKETASGSPVDTINNSTGIVLVPGGTVNGSSVASPANQLSKSSVPSLIEEAKKTLFIQANYLTYTYQRLAKTIRGLSLSEIEGLTTDQTWLCTMCSLNSIHKRHVSIARLDNPVNLGRSSEGIYFIILVITPTKEKGTKSEIELGRTFATIFADVEFRQQLLYADSVEEFKDLLQCHCDDLTEDQALYRRRSLKIQELMNQAFHFEKRYPIGSGIISDLKKRIPYYFSDYKDGIANRITVQKVVSSTVFLYFACLLPCIAFGVLNYNNTDGKIDVRRVIVSQSIGGLCFGLIGGQPLIILLTTAPLALYIKVIFSICEDYKIDFSAMYCLVGLMSSILLAIYALLDLSKLMKWSTRSSEEIFALFIAIAFIVDAIKDVYKDFSKHYFSCGKLTADNGSLPSNSSSVVNISMIIKDSNNICQKEVSILYLFLVVATVWLAVQMFNITKTPFLNNSKRELLTDFALPVSVIVMSLIGSVIFKDVPTQKFQLRDEPIELELLKFHKLPWFAYLGGLALAFPLSLLIFMDQNIASAMVNSPANRLKKGSAYHWDLMVVAVVNGLLSVLGLPWVHGTLPHSPLHVNTLADIEERIDIGHNVHQTIVRVRETRLTSLLSHVMIAASLALLPQPLSYIPVPVLDALFIYMAVSSLFGNQFFERILLLFTEQSAYPPSHYIRRVPQRKLHIFTGLQLAQLGGLCLFGFAPSPYLKIVFPLLLIFHLVFRHLVVPKIIDDTYLNALDKPV